MTNLVFCSLFVIDHHKQQSDIFQPESPKNNWTRWLFNQPPQNITASIFRKRNPLKRRASVQTQTADK